MFLGEHFFLRRNDLIIVLRTMVQLVFVLDTSGSMNQRTDKGITYLDVAKNSIETFLTKVPSPVGPLRSYHTLHTVFVRLWCDPERGSRRTLVAPVLNTRPCPASYHPPAHRLPPSTAALEGPESSRPVGALFTFRTPRCSPHNLSSPSTRHSCGCIPSQ